MRRIAGILLILIFTVTAAFAQELRLVVSNRPLNQVLNGLPVEVSFDDTALSRYSVTVNHSFKSGEEAVKYLLHGKPFAVEKIGQVYVISSTKKKEYLSVVEKEPVRQYYTISGIVSDKDSRERLPHAFVSIDRGTVETNRFGSFSVRSDEAKAIPVQIQYLGYELLDTLLTVGNHQILLSPKSIVIDDVVVYSPPATMLIQSGRMSGEVRINQQIAQYMPGSIDNSVFNLLRMMPGVRASGEPSDDLIVWGSNPGETQITYDGFSLFGLKNFNDHISLVNPYMVKDIRLLKGGYRASHGNRVGAIADIVGIEGDSKPALKANVSNYTANAYTSVPIGKRSSISAAYRQTFYNLYEKDKINSTGDHDASNISDIYIKPKYDFKDANLKFSTRISQHDNFYISLYGADDRFRYSVTQNEKEQLSAAEKNVQYAGAMSYNRLWNNGVASNVLVSYSRFASTIDNLTIEENATVPLAIVNTNTTNSIHELSAKVDHKLNIGQRNQVNAGIEWKYYGVKLNGSDEHANIPTAYITDNILLGQLSVEAGLRADLAVDDKLFIQPRLSGRYRFSEQLTATASWGIYRQYLTRTPFSYESGNHQLVWSVNDSTFLRAMHTVIGAAYSKNGFLASIEGYVKQVYNGRYSINNDAYSADNTIWGGSIFLNKEIGKHTAFGSYSLVKTKQPQNNTGHEIKLGGVASLRSVFLSFSYVYGTGFPYLSTGGHGYGHGSGQGGHNTKNGNHGNEDMGGQTQQDTYSRFDIAATYKLNLRNCEIQTGVSLLNIFDTRNIKYNYRISDENSIKNVYTKATPFTPMLFVEIKL